jgi:putative IMPACT (imprinted ancient) family translation regulator
VAHALESLSRAERVTWVGVRVVVGYADVRAVQELVAAHGGRVRDEAWGADVRWALQLPAGAVAPFTAAVRDATRGQGTVEVEA